MQIYNVDVLQYITNCLCLDAIILNEDRHCNNMGIVEKSKSECMEAPIFDNGLSLLADVKLYESLPFFKAVRRAKSKPFSTSFEKQVKAARELGGQPLRINIESLNKDLSQYINLLYPEAYVNRAISVIRYNLEKLEGLAWIRVNK